MSRLPSLAVSLALLGAACGGSSGPAPLPCKGAAEPLFVVDRANNAIACIPTTNPPAGTSLTAQVIQGISAIGDNLAYDRVNDRLYATSDAAVVVFDHATEAAGLVQPTRSFTALGVGLTWPLYFQLDRATDTLYLSGSTSTGGSIVLISGASTARGAVVPTRTIEWGGGYAFAVDTSRDLVYLAGGCVVSGVTSGGPLTRVGCFFRSGTGVSVDTSRDRLYVADSASYVYAYDGASTATTAAPLTPCESAPYGIPENVTIDAAHDRLYVGAVGQGFIVNGASGGIDRTRAITAAAPAGSILSGFAFP